MPRYVRIALVQALPVSGDFANPANVEHAIELMDRACRGEPDIVVFPEYFPFYDDKRVAAKAVDCGAYVVAGVRYVESGIAYNTATIYSPEGGVAARQGKRSIGRLEARLWGFKPWPYEYVVLDTGKVKLGVAVCADFWSTPEAALELFLGGAEVFVNPSYMFSLAEHWVRANQARSLEFYVPVIGVDTAAFTFRSKRFTFTGGGLSHVIVPPSTTAEAENWWSKGAQSTDSWVRLRMGLGEEVAVYQLELDGLEKMRRDWWRRMRGVGLEEWVRLKLRQGYPAARLIRA